MEKPVRIGLIKKKQSREEREEADFSDEGDELMSQALSVADPKEHDETVQPLTNSTMKVLEGLVELEEEEITVLERSTDSSDDIFEDDIERDRDPDYVQPAEVPGTSRDTRAKGKALLKPTSTGGAKNTPSTSTDSTVPVPLPGGRTKAPIWAYFVADDKKIAGHLNKGAICQVKVGGAVCGKRLLQNGSTTSGLNHHLFSQHPKVWETVKSAKANKEAERLSAKRNLSSLMDKLEGTPKKKQRIDEGQGQGTSTEMSGIKPMVSGKTPWNRVQKYDARGRVQLRFDLWLTEYWVRLGLPWSMLDTPAHKEFWNRIDPKLHLKHSSTYRRAKLHLLYDQVKNVVENQIRREVTGTTGIAFTADHWTSRNMDPYFGVTLHLINKKWEMQR